MIIGGGIGGRKESGQLRFGGRDRPFKKPLMKPLPDTYVHNIDDRYSYCIFPSL